jgi:endonuclease/exonuclease/phosphatase family metal-dependent hydrolase
MDVVAQTHPSNTAHGLEAHDGHAPLSLFKRRQFPPAKTQVPPKPDKILRLFTLNVAHARRQVATKPFVRRRTARRNLKDIAHTVRQVQPDIVALQEADGPSAWSGNFDHVATLAELAELEAHFRGNHNPFGLGRFQLASGTALLARQPLLDPMSHRFGLSWRDTKGFVAATIVVQEWGGLEVDVVSVHLDFLTPSMRRRQIHQMAEILTPRERPLVVLGDLNCCWLREPQSMELLTKSLALGSYQPEMSAPTYPTYNPRRRFDWILVSPQLVFRGYHTVHVPLSDHLVLVADLGVRDVD